MSPQHNYSMQGVSHSFGQQRILAEWAGITGKPGLNSLEPFDLSCCDPPILNEYVISQVGLLPFVSQLGHNLNWRVSHAQKIQEPADFSGMLIRPPCSDHQGGLVLTTSGCGSANKNLSAGRTACAFFLHVLTPIFLPTVATFWLQITNFLFHQTATFRSEITLINANMGQDHFQEHQVQVFAAVTKHKNRL